MSKIRKTKHVWNSDQKKEARKETIIDCYKKLIGRDCLPSEKQYWTMCGRMDTGDEEFERNLHCEYEQVLNSGLIVPAQFRGVDNSEDYINKNKVLYPDLVFYCNDFMRQVYHSFAEADFNPGIVNVDMVYMPKKAASYSAEMLYFIEGQGIKDIMVVCNLMLNNPRRGEGDIEIYKHDDFYELLKSESKWRYCQHYWNFYDAYEYYNHKTNMCSYIFTTKQ